MTTPDEPDGPHHIMVAGDWHGDTYWARHVVGRARRLLTADRPRILLHLGDLGVAPGPTAVNYLNALDDALDDIDAQLWFIDGDDDCRPMLQKLHRDHHGRGILTPRILYLPRGHRWDWHGHRWLAAGGATTGRARRFADGAWWPEEELTDADVRAAAAGGRTDVLVCHDCPTRAHPTSRHTGGGRDRAAAHRVRLQHLTDATRPRHILHGHLHTPSRRLVDMRWADTRVSCLAAARSSNNWGVFNTRTLDWVTPLRRHRPPHPREAHHDA